MQESRKSLRRGISRGELARRTGVNIETIRYFETVGILAAPPRTDGGHRVYGEEHVRTLSFIKRARELGFAPADVRAILQVSASGKACCAEVRDIAIHHLSEVRAKMADLAELERLLATTVAHCEGGSAPECAVIDMLDSGSAK